MGAPGPTQRFFDLWSLVYDLPWVQRAVYRPPQDAIVARLRRARCRRVLDVGCGTGLLAARIRREVAGARVVGCDFSRGMLRQARRRDGRGSWVQGDGGRLPFRSAAFDAVVSTEAFHWFPDQRAALREFRRVLRSGGRLMIAVVNPRLALTGRLLHLASRLVGEPFYWPTRSEVRRLARAAGFHVEEQARLFRVPGLLFVPPVLTVATAAESPVAPPSAQRRVTGRRQSSDQKRAALP
jgi:ubiquinone/menaquinone biosynthesis C-methylase UbiE